LSDARRIPTAPCRVGTPAPLGQRKGRRRGVRPALRSVGDAGRGTADKQGLAVVECLRKLGRMTAGVELVASWRIKGSMWLLVAPEPAPDVPYWPGRRGFAGLDAVAWPVAWAMLVTQLPTSTGVVGPLLAAIALVAGFGRVRRAVWQNHRYRFTTWRWGRIVAAMLLVGLVLKSMVV